MDHIMTIANPDLIVVIGIFLILAHYTVVLKQVIILISIGAGVCIWSEFSPKLSLTVDFIHGYPRVLEHDISLSHVIGGCT